MRIIAGKNRGRKLVTLEGLATRPTLDGTKEAIFSSLGGMLPDYTILDVFGGSGALSLESISRGAKKAYILDNNLEHISFKGYSQDEINRKIAKAEKEERYYKGMVEHELSMAKHSTDNAGREYHTSKASNFAKEAAKWHEEAIKWKYTNLRIYNLDM